MAEKSSLPRRSRSRSLPDELEAEILLWLPVKTLIRFKSACKSWYSLISSPQFQKYHFRRAQHKPPLLLTLKTQFDVDNNTSARFSTYMNNKKEETLTLLNNFSKPISPSRYMESCLGLVCLFERFGLFGQPVLVCNPSTQELISLPLTTAASRCVGFGYAASSEDFKVVRFFSRHNNPRCQVYTLGTNCWREGRTPPFNVFEGIAPFFHEAIHFLPRISMIHGVTYADCLGVFDIETEEFREGIRLPAYYYNLGDCEGCGIVRVRDFLRLTTLASSLCLTFDFRKPKRLLELWLLRDYNNAEWVKGYTIDLSVCPCVVYPSDTEGGEILLTWKDNLGVSLLAYDPQDGTVTVKKDKECAATFYVETFYPLGRR